VRSILCVLVGIAVMASGCRSVDIVGTSHDSVIGRPVQSVMQAHTGNRIQMFDKDGKPMQKLSQQRGASVSIHCRDQTGQDNYTYDEKGVIIKHLRSHGENYRQGIWKEVK